MLAIGEPPPSTGEPPPSTVAPRLTDKETTIIFLLSAGHTTPEIASLLELRPRTVENHKRHIYEKLGVGSQSHAVAKAIWLGLLQPGRPRPLLLGTGRPQPSGEPGRATLAVLVGPTGEGRDEVQRVLLMEQLACVAALKREKLIADHWLRSHAGPMVAVLVDPAPEDWSAAISLGAPIVVVRTRDVPEQLAVADALARRASGLVAKADIATGLGPALSVVAQGLLVMSWRYAESLMKWASATPQTAPKLTARENDILALLACGHTIRQTGRALGIAAKTVENTQARLFRKLGARNRMEALTIADGWGLIDRTMVPISTS